MTPRVLNCVREKVRSLGFSLDTLMMLLKTEVLRQLNQRLLDIKFQTLHCTASKVFSSLYFHILLPYGHFYLSYLSQGSHSWYHMLDLTSLPLKCSWEDKTPFPDHLCPCNSGAVGPHSSPLSFLTVQSMWMLRPYIWTLPQETKQIW